MTMKRRRVGERELELSPALARRAGRKLPETNGRAVGKAMAKGREDSRSESRGVAIVGQGGEGGGGSRSVGELREARSAEAPEKRRGGNKRAARGRGGAGAKASDKSSST